MTVQTAILPRTTTLLTPVAPRALPMAEAIVTQGMHPVVIGLALGGFGLFMVAAWIGFGFGYQRLLLVVVLGIGAIYFGLLLGMGADAASHRPHGAPRSFRSFLNGRMAIDTGTVSGAEAVVQIAFAPLLLGLLMGFLAVLWLTIR